VKRQKRNALLAGALIILAGCLDVSFTVAKSATLTVDATSSTYSGTVLVDLSTNSDFQKHKGNVNGISLEKVVVSVASINAGNASTQLTSGSISLRADGAPADGSQDVKVGTISALVFHDYLVATAGGGGKTFTVPLDNAQALNKFLMDNVVRGSGKFSAVVNAQTDQAQTHITLQLDLTNSLSYGLL
jgi:hypothetical protein